MIFPFVDDVVTPNKEPLPLYKEYAYDFTNNKYIVRNGNLVIVEGNDAIKIWCYKALLTPRYQYIIYSWNYGSELQELIGKAYTKGLTKSEAARYVEEALMINPYITEVNVNNTTFDGDILTVSATVNTIYGKVEVNI